MVISSIIPNKYAMSLTSEDPYICGDGYKCLDIIACTMCSELDITEIIDSQIIIEIIFIHCTYR